jgi:hypothetical protein
MREMPFFDEEFSFEEHVIEESPMPTNALCLKVPGTEGEELVVHREGKEDYVFLFEALDDATDYAKAAEEALGFKPDIGRVRVSELHFRTARFKPAVGEQVDISLRRR